jgi:hypothetical protein
VTDIWSHTKLENIRPIVHTYDLTKLKIVWWTNILAHSGWWAQHILSVRDLQRCGKKAEGKKHNARNSQNSSRGGAARLPIAAASSCAPLAHISPADPVPAGRACPPPSGLLLLASTEARYPLGGVRCLVLSAASRFCVGRRWTSPPELESIPPPSGKQSLANFLVLFRRIPLSSWLRSIEPKSSSPRLEKRGLVTAVTLPCQKHYACSLTEPQR